MNEIDQYPYVLLNAAMNPVYRRDVINRALSFRQRASLPARISLQTVLQNTVKVNGFRNSTKAPASALLPSTIQSFQRHSDLVRAILNVWLEAESNLRQQVKTILAEIQTVIQIDALPENGFTHSWTTETMGELAAHVFTLLPSAKQDDVALMLCCLTGGLPVVGQENDEIDTPNANQPNLPEQTQTGKEIGTKSHTSKPVDTVVETDKPAVDVEPAKNMPLITPADPVDDPEYAYTTLRKEIGQATALLEIGDFDALLFWTRNYERIVRITSTLFRDLRLRLREQGALIENTIAQEVAVGDAESMLIIMRQIQNALSGSPEAQIEALKQVIVVQANLSDYLSRRNAALAAWRNVSSTCGLLWQRAQNLELKQDHWQKIEDPISESNSIREIEQSTKHLGELGREIEKAITDTRNQLISSLIDQCTQLRVQIEAFGANTKRGEGLVGLSEIETELMSDVSDVALMAVQSKLDAIQANMPQSDLGPEIAEAAATYLVKPEQYYLEYILDALWNRGNTVEAFVVLGAAIYSGRWQSGDSQPERCLAHYIQGLIDIVPPNELTTVTAELLVDGMLTNLVDPDRPNEKAGMLILYIASYIRNSTLLPSAAFWKYREPGLARIAPKWWELAERIMLQDYPPFMRREQTEFTEVNELKRQLTNEFRRDGGKYIHLAGVGSKVLLNMEQKYLLPAMEKHWQALANTAPSNPAWQELRQRTFAMKAADLFIEHCSRAGLSADVNRHFQHQFEERLEKLLHLMCNFIAACEAMNNVLQPRPITWEDLLEEMEQIRAETGNSIAQIAETAIGEAMTSLKSDRALSISTVAFSQRIRKVLLDVEHIRLSLVSATAWLGQQTLDDANEWNGFFNALLQGLSRPQDVGDSIEAYLLASLPHLAEGLAVAHGRQEDVQRALQLRERLEKQVRDNQSQLERLGGQLTLQECTWLEEKRYALVLHSIITRIEKLESERKHQERDQQKTFRQIYTEVTELEPRVVDAMEMPAATRDDMFAALQAVRQVYLHTETNRLGFAQELLAEINHLLTYPGANAEGLIRHLEQLKATAPTVRLNVELETPTSLLDDDALSEIARVFRDDDLARIGLEPDSLSDNQRDDRANLLDLWRHIAGLPMDPAALTQSDIDAMKRFATLFAKTVTMYYGDLVRSSDSVTHVWASRPIPHFETRLTRPRMAALRSGVTLIFATEHSISKRWLREMEHLIDEEPWLRNGSFIVFVAPAEASVISDWLRRRYAGKSCTVLDEKKIVEVVLATNNPRATGVFRRLLLRVAGPDRFDVFKFENLVDSDQEIFAGRKDWITPLVNSNQSHAIYGGRRIGKSSLLNSVEKELRRKGGIKTAYVSLEGTDSQSGVLIAKQILQKLGISSECSSLMDFKSKVTIFLDANPDVRVVIFLDEVDRYITARKADNQPHDLIHCFRSLHQEQHGRCRFILAGFIEMWRQLVGKGGLPGQETPWFNFLVDNGPLEGLLSADAQAIVAEGFQEVLGITLDTESIPRQVVETTTLHPAFVQKFCERLHRRLYARQSDRLTLEDVQAVFEDRGESNFLSFVNHTLSQNLNPLPRLIVYLLAVEKKDRFTVEEVKKLAISYDKRFSTVTDNILEESLDELRITSVIKGPPPYQFSVPSYPKILSQYEVTNQDVISQLIRDILGEVA